MKAILIAATLALSGCATYISTLHKDDGQTYVCNFSGSGLMFMHTAQVAYDDCVRDAESKGFKK